MENEFHRNIPFDVFTPSQCVRRIAYEDQTGLFIIFVTRRRKNLCPRHLQKILAERHHTSSLKFAMTKFCRVRFDIVSYDGCRRCADKLRQYPPVSARGLNEDRTTRARFGKCPLDGPAHGLPKETSIDTMSHVLKPRYLSRIYGCDEDETSTSVVYKISYVYLTSLEFSSLAKYCRRDAESCSDVTVEMPTVPGSSLSFLLSPSYSSLSTSRPSGT
mmetsp:Transcript_24809/g.57130  ORF Transcript_24809/g.57130 Transcript_24809/m.57130 type:complete len:217 (+) Transcript_24809:379-1029(+)